MLQATIEEVRKNKPLGVIIVDFSDITGIDSVGINCIKEIIIFLKRQKLHLELEGFTETLFMALLNHYRFI